MAPFEPRDFHALVRAGIIGHAVGDALGVPVEFSASREELQKHPVREMRSGGRYGMPKGTWSDDTSMEIAFMQSYFEKHHFDEADIMTKFASWFYGGLFTATGQTFGTGRTCSQAIERFMHGQEPELCGVRSIKSNGNGSLMRILPAAYICEVGDLRPDQQFDLVSRLSSLTHAHEISILGCQIYVTIARELLRDHSLYHAYNVARAADYSMFSPEAVAVYNRLLLDRITCRGERDISSSGYVVDTLEAALWCLLTTSTYRSAVETAVNLGKDSDTIAAVTGGLAGIYYGFVAIPYSWLSDLQRLDYLFNICDNFAAVLSGDS